MLVATKGLDQSVRGRGERERERSRLPALLREITTGGGLAAREQQEETRGRSNVIKGRMQKGDEREITDT
jgi:hypothetical protein